MSLNHCKAMETRRRGFQFSIRSLLIVMALVAGILGILRDSGLVLLALLFLGANLATLAAGNTLSGLEWLGRLAKIWQLPWIVRLLFILFGAIAVLVVIPATVWLIVMLAESLVNLGGLHVVQP